MATRYTTAQYTSGESYVVEARHGGALEEAERDAEAANEAWVSAGCPSLAGQHAEDERKERTAHNAEVRRRREAGWPYPGEER